MKKILLFITVLICAAVFTTGVAAAENTINVVLDGRKIEFDVEPRNINDRVLVPLRAIFEELGAEVFWDSSAETVTAIKGTTAVVLTIGNNRPTVNGVAVEIDQPGIIIDGRTLAPLRFVAEAFGGTANWDGANNTAYITFETEADAPPAFLYHSTVEYGEPDIILEWREPLLVYIRFPHSDDFSGKIIEDWAYETYQKSLDEINGMRVNDESVTGELNIHFDSYFVGNRLVGVVEKGMFMHSHLAHPIDIIRTFNYNYERGSMLSNDEIIDRARYRDVLSLLRAKLIEALPDAEPFIDDMDDDWLSNIAIGPDGIIVILERGVFLPGYMGSVTVALPYGDLGTAFLLNTEPLPETVMPGEPEAQADQREGRYIDPSKPMVAMTFDDGPSKYTSQILDILERYNGRATFCVVGNLAEGRSDTILRSYNMGNDIIGHSYDHRDLTKLSQNEIRAQMLGPDGIIESITGVSPKLLRTPYGAVNDAVRSVAKELGFSIIFWSVDTLDWQSRNANSVYNAVMKDVGDKSIVLCHDLYASTAEAMERVIPELVSRGYQLVTVSEMIKLNGGEFEPGRMYSSGR